MTTNTSELFNELKNPECSLEKYLSQYNDFFVNEDIQSFWNHIINNKRISKTHIINESDFSYCYFYEVINGRKIPTKDKIIRLVLAMELTVDECQQALRLSGHCTLFPNNRRDSIIIYAIEHNKTILQCNELLHNYNEYPLK